MNQCILSDFLEKWSCQIKFDQLDDFHNKFLLRAQDGDIDYIEENVHRITDENFIRTLFFVAVGFSKTTENDQNIV